MRAFQARGQRLRTRDDIRIARRAWRALRAFLATDTGDALSGVLLTAMLFAIVYGLLQLIPNGGW